MHKLVLVLFSMFIIPAAYGHTGAHSGGVSPGLAEHFLIQHYGFFALMVVAIGYILRRSKSSSVFLGAIRKI